MSRRTAAGAAAWTVPVLAVAAPAPAYAASTTCAGFAFPAMPTSGTSGNGWTHTVSGTMRANGTNGFIAGPAHAVIAVPSSGSVTITASISVLFTSGGTYTFKVPFQKLGSNPRRQTAELQIDGVAQAGGFIDSDVGPDNTTQELTVTFRPTTTRQYVVAVVHKFAASSTSNVGDDIGVGSPVVTCS